jgi:hypothetical protein
MCRMRVPLAMRRNLRKLAARTARDDLRANTSVPAASALLERGVLGR